MTANVSFCGLSPLARGKRRVAKRRILQVGPIPAGAGETAARRDQSQTCRAYPRWRGGNTCTHPDAPTRWGLSPLARGKLQVAEHFHSRRGPIPAGAGETTCGMASSRASRAYPRWRGGNVVSVNTAIQQQGLSPLARGKQGSVRPGELASGPIPAGAGETFDNCRWSK